MKTFGQFIEALTSDRAIAGLRDFHSQIDAQIKAIESEMRKAVEKARRPYAAQIKALNAKKTRLTVGAGGRVSPTSFGDSHELPQPANTNPPFMRGYNLDRHKTTASILKNDPKAIAIYYQIMKRGKSTSIPLNVSPEEGRRIASLVSDAIYEDEYDDDFKSTSVSYNPATRSIDVSVQEEPNPGY
jgi:hypothetical protein